jgi:hypothetical protein
MDDCGSGAREQRATLQAVLRMSNGQRGLDAFEGHVLREFQIANPALANEATRTFIAKKFKERYSVDATVRDLRHELHAQLAAQMPPPSVEPEVDSLV